MYSILSKCQLPSQVRITGQCMAQQQVANLETYLFCGLVLETTSIPQIFQPGKMSHEQSGKTKVHLNLDLDAELDEVCSVVLPMFILSHSKLPFYSQTPYLRMCLNANMYL